MATDAEVNALRLATGRLVSNAQSAVRQLWRETQGLPPEGVRDAFLDVLPSIVETFGAAAGELAATYFEQTTGSLVEPAQTPPAEQVRAQTRYRAGALFGGAGDFTAGLSGDVDRLIKSTSRNTIFEGAQANQLGFVRVPSGPVTCGFCLMLASRSAGEVIDQYMYHSRASAGARGTGNEYHNDCDCGVVAVRGRDDVPESFNPEELYDMYRIALDNAGSMDAKSVVYQLRKLFPDAVKDPILE